MKEISISLRINGHLYEGTALYDEDTDRVDLSNITAEGIDAQSTLTQIVHYEGYYLTKVMNILEYNVRSKVKPEAYGACEVTGYKFPIAELVSCYDGDVVYNRLAAYSCILGRYLNLTRDGSYVQIRHTNGDIRNDYVTEDWISHHCHCAHCDSYLEDDSDYVGDDTCRWCDDTCRWHDEPDVDAEIIENYGASHKHNEHPVFFGCSADEKELDKFSGMGFELEVDSKEDDFSTSYNEKTARELCSEAGLDDNEMRYAHDGSLNYGFECISQPHTVKDFWAKTKKWEKMLKYLLSRGYRSHDPGTCGLHIHVSRNMFGNTVETQNTAIAKVYTFYDENWDDLVKASRRKDFGYCDKNVLSLGQRTDSLKTGKYKQWKERSQAFASKNHYVALNNSGRYTFEYRLGRGTLNAWSFFSWIDLTLTITKNARRITIKQVDSNDKVSWLSGITESTARYLYQRGAFRETALALYPSITWSRDTSDNDDE